MIRGDDGIAEVRNLLLIFREWSLRSRLNPIKGMKL
jgi:hypothetical protein